MRVGIGSRLLDALGAKSTFSGFLSYTSFYYLNVISIGVKSAPVSDHYIVVIGNAY